MFLIEMRSNQIQDAVKRNIPIIIPAGVVEYHGPHLPVGTDILIAEAVCRKIEKSHECIVAPSFPYGSTMNWAGGAKDGEIDFDPDTLYIYSKEVFKGFIDMGFRRIYVLQHHQGSEGLQTLCLKKAAGEVIREIVKGWKPGWGRKPEETWPIPEIFNMIMVAHPDSYFTYLNKKQDFINFQHAGKCETEFILAAKSNTVCMDALISEDRESLEWIETAFAADVEDGKRWIELCAKTWIQELKKS